MKTIASTDHYVIQVDETKNRLIFVMKGSWTDAKAVPNWHEDINKAIDHLSPGFTEFVDWTQVGAIALTGYIARTQELLMKAGVRKVARLYTGERFVKIQMDDLSKKIGFPVRSFFNREEAEAWLNED